MSEKLYPWRWWICSAYLLAWTVALLVPIPQQEDWMIGGVDVKPTVYWTKGLHIAAYALMAILAGWLRVPTRYRFLLMYCLMVHATVTEVLQLTLEFLGRGGSLRDVALDHIGIALGVLLAWRWWTADGA